MKNYHTKTIISIFIVILAALLITLFYQNKMYENFITSASNGSNKNDSDTATPTHHSTTVCSIM